MSEERQLGKPIATRGDGILEDPVLFQEEHSTFVPSSLKERFVWEPLSIIDMRQGPWTRRKEAWLHLGIRSELGREEGLISKGGAYGTNTSVFDPMLCELVYRWFAPKNAQGQLEGRVLDPFAGGSVRGVVAGALGLAYDGFELRGEQVMENRKQAAVILGPKGAGGLKALASKQIIPSWHNADALEILERFRGEADLIFTCPPYADLEVYSDDPRDLSQMSYARFRSVMDMIVAMALEKLREDRFAAVVIGDVRAPNGSYRNLPSHMIESFTKAGAQLWNQAVLRTPAASAAVRAARIFTPSRKLVNTHQFLQVFVKGDGKKAAEHARGPKEPTEAPTGEEERAA